MTDHSITLQGIVARRVEPGIHAFDATLSVCGKPIRFEVKAADLTSYSSFQQTAALATGQVFVSPECDEALPGREDRVWQRLMQKMLRESAGAIHN